jgi:hypothetical protein
MGLAGDGMVNSLPKMGGGSAGGAKNESFNRRVSLRENTEFRRGLKSKEALEIGEARFDKVKDLLHSIDVDLTRRGADYVEVWRPGYFNQDWKNKAIELFIQDYPDRSDYWDDYLRTNSNLEVEEYPWDDPEGPIIFARPL